MLTLSIQMAFVHHPPPISYRQDYQWVTFQYMTPASINNFISQTATNAWVSQLFRMLTLFSSNLFHHLGSLRWSAIVLRYHLPPSAIFLSNPTIFRSLSTASLHLVFLLFLVVSCQFSADMFLSIPSNHVF